MRKSERIFEVTQHAIYFRRTYVIIIYTHLTDELGFDYTTVIFQYRFISIDVQNHAIFSHILARFISSPHCRWRQHLSSSAPNVAVNFLKVKPRCPNSAVERGITCERLDINFLNNIRKINEDTI